MLTFEIFEDSQANLIFTYQISHSTSKKDNNVLAKMWKNNPLVKHQPIRVCLHDVCLFLYGNFKADLSSLLPRMYSSTIDNIKPVFR